MDKTTTAGLHVAKRVLHCMRLMDPVLAGNPATEHLRGKAAWGTFGTLNL